MMPLREIDILGVFVTPAMICVAAALVVTYGLRRLFDIVRLDRFVWNRALFDVSVLVCVTSLLVLSLRWPGP